jgi:hypothetical protein
VEGEPCSSTRHGAKQFQIAILAKAESLMKAIWLAFVFLLTVATWARAEPAKVVSSNAEMSRIFSEDQADRRSLPTTDWGSVIPRDKARRSATKTLLQEGDLRTAEDFRNAAFVFQHGDQPGDYLLAHTLAMVAVSLGDRPSLWIASATLDRYLWAVKQAQIFGTQSSLPNTADAVGTQEPYDRGLISDALRRALGVPTQPEQQEQLEKMQAEQRAAYR